MTQNQNLILTPINETPFLPETPDQVSTATPWIVGVTALGTLAVLAYGARRFASLHPGNSKDQPPRQFTSENLTASFIAAIPIITRELNLETAIANQTETFTQTSGKTTLWGLVDLGTNTVQVRVPVTYRYHICLREPWELKPQGETLLVLAPRLRASLPPAIHTNQVERMSVRGWCRATPTDLLEQLERQITPAIAERASDPKQLDLVRPSCRLSVAEFVRLWLEREGQGQTGGFTAIHVRFAEEATLPPEPTVKLLS